MASVSSLISANRLSEIATSPNVKIFDGTWVLPGDPTILPEGFIPGALIFDIDEIADRHSSMKHMLPTPSTFSRAMSAMGITNDDHIVVYDRKGVFSSPRVWWTFRMFGHERVSVLDGGLPAWIGAGYTVNNHPGHPSETSKYRVKAPLSGVITQRGILSQLDQNPQILDARPAGRFTGSDPEPRQGLRSGHIPGSTSLAYSNILAADKTLKSISEIKAQLRTLNIDLTQPIITSCGSGITAAGLAFALHLVGKDDVRVYDGSWVEWGASDAPIEQGHSA